MTEEQHEDYFTAYKVIGDLVADQLAKARQQHTGGVTIIIYVDEDGTCSGIKIEPTVH